MTDLLSNAQSHPYKPDLPSVRKPTSTTTTLSSSSSSSSSYAMDRVTGMTKDSVLANVQLMRLEEPMQKPQLPSPSSMQMQTQMQTQMQKRTQTTRMVPLPNTWISDLCPKQLSTYVLAHLKPEYIDLQNRMFKFMDEDLFKPRYGLDMYSYRDLTLKRLQKICSQGFIHAGDVTQDPKRFMVAMQCLHFADYTLSIKAGVHFTLCGGSIAKLGTKYHHDKYLPKIDSLELPGCYGMTELGHGSNVMAIETTAKYDASTRMFDIYTPSNLASKFWIGGAAQHGKVCAVFAQLYDAENKWQGPHVFLVRIRDDDGNLMPNVRIGDLSSKMGLEGVDNGQIWFDHVKVPREDMLNRYSNIDENGMFSSSIPTVQQRFGTMIGGLTTGRFLIAAAAVDACKIALIISVRYSLKRTQFGDKVIMEYITHQRRLIPALAMTYALDFAMHFLSNLMTDPKTAREVHYLSSGLKAMATWKKTEILQLCREACGGMGFLSSNQIGGLIKDMNVDVTFEGDNTVLYTQVVKGLLAERSQSGNKLVADEATLSAPLVSNVESIQGSLNRLMSWKESMLLAQVVKLGPKCFDENLDLVLQLAGAHIEKRVLEIFQARAANAPSVPMRSALLSLVHLYGLGIIEKDLGIYMSHGAVPATPVMQEQLRVLINQMCVEIGSGHGQGLLKLCEGFGIPEQFITAPIAHDWTKMKTASKL